MKELQVRKKTFNPHLVFRILILGVFLAVITGGFRFQNHTEHALAVGSPSSATPCVGASAPAQWRHVVVLMFENKTYSQVVGSASAPYITNLANQCGVATPQTSAKNGWHDSNYKVDGTTDGNYQSKPSYATLTNGVPPSVHGIIDDTYTTTTTVDNIYNQLYQAGKSFKDYYDGPASTTPCASSNFSGAYHDAIRYYTNLGGQSSSTSTICNTHDVPLSTFMTDVNSGNLPAFSMILPTNGENMHDNSIPSGDTWAQNFLKPFLDSAQYKSGDTAIFFLWDEDTPIPDVLIAPSIVSGSSVPVQTGNPISHFSGLRTFEEMLGLPFIGNAAQAPSLLSFFNGGVTPPVGDTSPPSQPTNLTANVVSSTQINLSWTASTDNVGVAGYKIYRNNVQIATSATNSYSDTNLTTSTTYNYYVIATDAAGNNSPSSSTVSATTQPPPCPTLPTNLGTATQTINITTAGNYRVWSRIMGGGDTSNSYYLQIDSDCAVDVGDLAGMTTNTWNWVDYQDGTITSKTNVTLTAGAHTLKYVGREAGLKLDNVLLTTDITCTPTGDGSNCLPDTTAPNVSITSPANGASVSGVVPVNVNATDDRGIVSKVELWVDNALISTLTTLPFNFSWDTTGLPNGNHTLVAKATDPSSNQGSSSAVGVTVNNGDKISPTVQITSPTAGATLSGNSVTVSATATDNVGVTKVDFYVDQTLVRSLSTSPYSFTWNSTTFSNGPHSIVAVASDAANNSGSDTIAISVNNGDTTPPSTPTNLTASSLVYNQVKLAWTASTDNVGVAGYWIVRNGVTINSSTTNSYTDGTVTEKTSYNYQVIAYDAAANTSGLSNTASVTTPAAPDTSAPTAPTNLTATAVSYAQVNLSWSPSTDNVGVAGYYVFRNSQQIASVTTTSFGDTGLMAFTSYSYFVKAYDAAGNISTPSTTVSTVTLGTSLTLQFLPTDDAYIAKRYSSTNFGLKTTLQVDNSPIQQFLIKFTVSGVGTKTIASAKLRLYCVNKSKNGGSFYRVANNTWSEKTITWSNAPAADTTKFTSIANVSAGKWYEVDLKPLITGDGIYSLRMTTPATDAAWYSSKEGTNKPQLVITTQ